MSLMDKLKKSGTINVSSILSDSIYYMSKETTETGLPILNIALSGEIHGGVTSGVTVLSGESKVFKTMLGLYMVKAYLDKYDDAVFLFYDSEFGTPPEYFSSLGIDTDRTIHIPVASLDDIKFDFVSRIKEIERGDKVIALIDSIGNLASAREIKNAEEQNTAQDMSRAKDIKSFFRVITTPVNMKDIPCVVISHSYKEQGSMYPKTVVSGGCLVAGTKIYMSTGELKNVEDIKEGEFVKTRYGDKRVTHIWNPETLEDGNPECLKIIFSDGYKVTCSKSHKFLSPMQKWLRADELTEGTTLLLPDNASTKVVDITSVGTQPVYDIAVDDAEHYYLENGICSHNSGVMYSANTVFIVTKAQEKKGTDVVGFNFTINVEKSRFVKEKSRLSFQVLYDSGISKYSGLMDIALDAGCVIKPSNGWYQRVNLETGEVEEKKYRLADTNNDDFWEPILNSEKFENFVREKYHLGGKAMVQEGSALSEPDEELNF